MRNPSPDPFEQLVWGITGDGKAAAFEGWALVGFYVILAALTWYE